MKYFELITSIEGREGGVLIPFPRKLFFSNPSSNPTIPACVAQIEIPFPFFYCFFFMNPSPSAQNPISQPLKKAYPSSHFTHSRPSRNIAFLSEFNCVICLISSPFKLVLCGRIAGGDCLLFKEISFPNFAQ